MQETVRVQFFLQAQECYNDMREKQREIAEAFYINKTGPEA